MKARENPFCSHLLEQLPFQFPPGDSWPAFLQRLVEQKYVGAIVGRHGSGKTLLLSQLEPYLKDVGLEPVRFRLSAESSMKDKELLSQQLRSVQAPQIILLDGAEQLSTRMWLPVRSAATRAAGLIVTVHRVSRLPTLLFCETNPSLLQSLVQSLTEYSLSWEEADSMLIRHHGNVRECLRELYDRWAGDDVPEAPQADPEAPAA